MADGDELGIGARLAIGGIAGLVATVALTSTVKRLAPKARPSEPDVIDLLTPFAFGAAAGALLALANPRPNRVTGAIAGGGLWLAGEMGWLPEIVVQRAGSHPARASIAMLAGHIAWGWSAAEAIRELSPMR